jgi:hypothetical protein
MHSALSPRNRPAQPGKNTSLHRMQTCRCIAQNTRYAHAVILASRQTDSEDDCLTSLGAATPASCFQVISCSRPHVSRGACSSPGAGRGCRSGGHKTFIDPVSCCWRKKTASRAICTQCSGGQSMCNWGGKLTVSKTFRIASRRVGLHVWFWAQWNMGGLPPLERGAE